ncbi:MAG: hypothetical protein ABSF92_04960 [Candidatus Acidiferrales bacterium]
MQNATRNSQLETDFGGQKVAIPRPRVRRRQGEEVELKSYAGLQHGGRRQRAVPDGRHAMRSGLTSDCRARE